MASRGSTILFATLASLVAPGPLLMAADVTSVTPRGNPPRDMIDFLGRRQECSRRGARELAAPAPAGSRLEWLRCGDLPREQAALRQRYADDHDAIAFLDQPPDRFRNEQITVRTYEWPSGYVQRVEQHGDGGNSRTPWHVVLDRRAAHGRATAITASWGTRPARTAYLENAQLPWLDLSTLRVSMRMSPRFEGLSIELRYGLRRGWCGDLSGDDRPFMSIGFTPSTIAGSRSDMTNCGGSAETLPTRSRP